MNLQKKLIITYLLVALVPLTFVTLLNYTNTRNSLLATQQHALEQIADLKVGVIRDYFKNFQVQMAITENRTVVKTEFKTISQQSANPANAGFIASKSVLNEQMSTLISQIPDIENVIFADARQKIVYSTQLRYEQKQIDQVFPYFGTPVFKNGQDGLYFTDIYQDPRDQNFDFLLSAPIRDVNNIFLGVLIFEINAKNLYSQINDTKGLGQTGEVLLVRRIATGTINSTYQEYPYDPQGNYVLFLNPLRFDPGAAFKRTLRIGDAMGTPAQAAAQGQEGSGLATDYRGENTIAAWRYLPEKNWGLVAKIDLSELLMPVITVLEAMLIIGLVAILTIGFIAWLLARTIARPVYELTKIARKIGQGELNIKFDKQLISTNDEVGELGQTFNQMVVSLKESRQEIEKYSKGLEKAVADKTKELAVSLEKIKADNQGLEANKNAMLNLLEDIEREKEAAQVEKDKTETILYSIGDGVFVIDNNYKIIIFNDVAAKMSGYGIKEAIGKRYDQVLKFYNEENEKDNKLKDEFIKKVITTGQGAKMSNHTVLIAKDGTRLPVADSAAPLKDKNGQVIGCVVVFRDVTKERQIDQMKTEFVSVASHQLRTPLTGIKWFAELLLKNKLSAKEKEFVNQIVVSNDRMVKLVDDLLNVSRIETGRKFDIIPKPIDIVPVIRPVIASQMIAAKEKKVKIALAPDFPAKLVVLADSEKISQVFQNLINNSYKYSKIGGKVEVGYQPKSQEAVFYVKDNGIGIPKIQQNRIFERFFRANNALTTHTEGTGLGLYIVKAIVEGHHGRIWFESQEGKGTTFYFSLPLKQKEYVSK